MKLVLIQWEDSFFGVGEWQRFDELKSLPVAHCISCGLLLHETEDKVILIMNRGGTTGSQPIAIPRGCVKKMWKLRVNPL